MINLGYLIPENKDATIYVRQGDELEVNLSTSQIKNLSTGQGIQGIPLSGLEKEISWMSGTLLYLFMGLVFVAAVSIIVEFKRKIP